MRLRVFGFVLVLLGSLVSESPAGRAATQDPYADPVSFCRTVGTADVYDRRYTGPDEAPESLSAAGRFPLINWRCVEGRVFTCDVGASGRHCQKMDVSGVPNPEIRQYCASNPPDPDPPASIGGYANTSWTCRNGRPVFVETFPVDAQSYLVGAYKPLPEPLNAVQTTAALSGPFALCDIVGTSDDVLSGDDVAELREAAANGPLVWRCLNRAVLACQGGTTSRACMRLDVSPQPHREIRRFCNQNPRDSTVPAAILGASAWTWRCGPSHMAQRVTMTAVDQRGFQVSRWRRVPPPSATEVIQSTVENPRSSASYLLPVTPTGRIHGFFDPRYNDGEPRANWRQHLGADLPAAEGTSVVSPVDGIVTFNQTSGIAAASAFIVIREVATGAEHVLGHIDSPIRPGTPQASIRRGDVVGTVKRWITDSGRNNSHVHWGLNTRRVNTAVERDEVGDWGWGRAPFVATEAQVAQRGWTNPDARLGSDSPPRSRPSESVAAPTWVALLLGRTYPTWKPGLYSPNCATEWRDWLQLGDFNGDGSQDFVVKIVGGPEGGSSSSIVAFVSDRAGHSAIPIRDGYSEDENMRLAVRVRPRGTAYEDETGRLQRLNTDAPEIGYCEMSSWLMMLRNGAFTAVNTSD